MRAILPVLLTMVIFAGLPPGAVRASKLDPWVVQIILAEMLSADEAARQAKEQYGGRVLSVRLEQPQDQSPYYRVKLISDGNVRVVQIPAER